MEINLPDFEDMYKLSDEIYELSVRRAVLENKIKFEEAMVVKTVTTDPIYFKDGKAPSMAFIESTYKFTGLDNKIFPLREELGDVKAQLDQKQIVLDIYRMQVDVFRTLSANERKAVI
jgi:hypothetical protein